MTVRKTITILRKSDGKWSEVETAKAMVHFDTAICVDPCAPIDIAIVGRVKEELVEQFRLAHQGFEDLQVYYTHCTVRP